MNTIFFCCQRRHAYDTLSAMSYKRGFNAIVGNRDSVMSNINNNQIYTMITRRYYSHEVENVASAL